MPPLDLAVVFPHASVRGGVEGVALALTRYQAGRRGACFVGQSCDDDSLPFQRVNPARVPRSLRPWAFRRAAAPVLRDLDAGTVLSFGVNCPPGDVYWVQSVHGAWLEHGGEIRYRGVAVPPGIRKLLLRHQVLLRLERDYFVNHRPRAILCTSQQEVEDLARLYDVPSALMHVVPNGYDGAQFNVSRRMQLRGEARASIGAAADDIVVLLVANEWHRKGLGVLLEAVSRLGDSRVRVDLVGALSPSDYQPLAQRLGIAGRMRWHGPSQNVARFHAAADIFALPTTYEPFGMVIVEAMASGLPVVTSRLAGASIAIDHANNGLLLEQPQDVDELAGMLTQLLDIAERDRVGAAAADAATEYEWVQVMMKADAAIFRGAPT